MQNLVTKALAICLLMGAAFVNSCGSEATCTDGIQNQFETGIDCCTASSSEDCPCDPCGEVATCFDGVQNQDETDVDCGGACGACEETLDTVVQPENGTMTAIANGVPFIAENASGQEVLAGNMTITGIVGTQTISIQYWGPYETGTINLMDNMGSIIYSPSAGVACASVLGGGSITFTTFDTVNRVVAGTFEFTCKANQADDESEITSGTFAGINY